MIANINDTIQWTFEDSENVPEHLKGKTFEAKVAIIDYEERYYGVYAEYGQDMIDFDKCKIIN